GETAESVFDLPANASLERVANAAGVSDAAARRVQEGPRRTETVADVIRSVESAKSPVGVPPSPSGLAPTGERRALPNVPWPYGGFCLESMDAHGGWIASAVDLARFASALHDPDHGPLLK